MNHNIILEYTCYIRKELLKFYKIVLGNQYEKNIVEPLMDKYIMVRYFNKTNYEKEKDLIDRINKELEDVTKFIMNEKNEEQIKNIYSLFGYLPHFDDCYPIENMSDVIDVFFEDENIKVEKTAEMKKKLLSLFKRIKKSKDNFNSIFQSKQFILYEHRIKKNIYGLLLEHDVTVPNIHSTNSVEKAFNTGIIKEDKIFVKLTLASLDILNNAINLDFSRYYVVNFAKSLFSNDEKLERLFNIIDNELTKKHLIFNIMYEDYLSNKEKVRKSVKRGLNFSIVIDGTFDEDYIDMSLFSHVFLCKNDESYDIIIENKDLIATNLVIISDLMLLNYFSVKSITPKKKADIDKMTNELVEKIVEINTNLSEDEIRDMVIEKTRTAIAKAYVGMTEMQKEFTKQIKSYLENIEKFKFESEVE